MFLRMRLVMIGVKGMRIIRRRGSIRLCCMRYSRMSVNRGRRFRRGDIGRDWMGVLDGFGEDEGTKIYGKA